MYHIIPNSILLCFTQWLLSDLRISLRCHCSNSSRKTRKASIMHCVESWLGSVLTLTIHCLHSGMYPATIITWVQTKALECNLIIFNYPNDLNHSPFPQHCNELVYKYHMKSPLRHRKCPDALLHLPPPYLQKTFLRLASLASQSFATWLSLHTVAVGVCLPTQPSWVELLLADQNLILVITCCK